MSGTSQSSRTEIQAADDNGIDSFANVVGIGVGPKRVDGEITDEEALIVFVTEKTPKGDLDPSDVIPDVIPFDGDEIVTDVQAVGRLTVELDREARHRPVMAGLSGGHPDTSAGTIGSPPLQTEDGSTVILTNAHVGAPLGHAEAGDAFLQPGPLDGGSDDDVVGELKEFSDIKPDVPNKSDSALIAVDESTVVRQRIAGIDDLVGIERDPPDDATFTKSGRTTGVRSGTLRARDSRARVSGYFKGNPEKTGPAVFDGVTFFEDMSEPGDSGSLIGIERDDGFYATHLLFAGSGQVTIGIPIDQVEQVHGRLTVLTQDGSDGT